MKITDNGKTFQLPPEGLHRAVCYRFVDLGTSMNQFYGKMQHKMMVSWELVDKLMEPDENGESKPFVISKFYTVSLNEKAHLRRDLESWFSRKMSEEDVRNGVDISFILGKPAMVQVLHSKNEKTGKTYVDVTAVMPIPDGMEQPVGTIQPYKLDFENFDKEVFENLSDGLKNRIQQSEEWKTLFGENMPETQHQQTSNEYTGFNEDAGVTDTFDDDIPF